LKAGYYGTYVTPTPIMPLEHTLKIQSSTEVSQEEFRKIYKMNPEAELHWQARGAQRTLTLPNGVQYYTDVVGLGI
jgi:hypothetical protein